MTISALSLLAIATGINVLGAAALWLESIEPCQLTPPHEVMLCARPWMPTPEQRLCQMRWVRTCIE